MGNLKKYANYLLIHYKTIQTGDGGECAINLQRFIEDGTIKDILFKKSKMKSKIAILEIYKDRIQAYSESKNKNLNLVSFKKFEDIIHK